MTDEAGSQIDDHQDEALSSEDPTAELIPPADELEAARNTAKSLLAIVDVSRIVCVDDNFEGEFSDFVEACSYLSGTVKVSCIEQVDFSNASEIWRADLQAAWNELPSDRRKMALADAKGKAGMLDTSDQLNAGALSGFLDESIEFQPMTPADWGEASDQILASAEEQPTLVLFDQELGDGVAGIDLVVDLYARDAEQTMWAGLFTHTISVEDEGPRWDEIVAENPGIVPERFILLSKEHMGPESATFPQALKIALMSRPAALLRRCVSASISDQVQKAVAELDDMSPQEFERIVFGLSLEEGMWEVDMLLRLFDAILRSEVRSSLHTSAEARDATSLLRRLSEVSTDPTSNTSHAQRIYRRELYEESSHLNQIHAPIELGDIFETNTGRSMILVGQPCDLMVRRNGKRAPDIGTATLLKIDEANPNAGLQKDGGFLSGARPTFELFAFNGGSSAWVLLDRPLIAPIEALDFCALSGDGASRMPLLGGEPEWITQSWKQRHEVLVHDLTALVTDISAAPNNQAKRTCVKQFFGPRLLESVKYETQDTEFHFDLLRTARLRAPYSRALLTRFAVHLSRDAFEPSII